MNNENPMMIYACIKVTQVVGRARADLPSNDSSSNNDISSSSSRGSSVFTSGTQL